MWKPPRSVRNCLGGNPTLPQGPPWNWTLDNLSLSRKWVETFGKPPLLTNQQLSLIHIGWVSRQFHTEKNQVDDQTQVSTFSFSSYRLKHSHGTLKENLVHILQTPSTWWNWSKCCLLHQWKVWHHQQPKIGTAKSGNQLILSFPQRHPSLLWVELHQVFQHQGIPPIPLKVFCQLDIPHQRNNCHGMQWKLLFHLCRIMQWLGLLVSSVLSVWTCETWNYVEYSSPLVYSKFYSSDT